MSVTRRPPPRYRGFTVSSRVKRIVNPAVTRAYAGGRVVGLGRRRTIRPFQPYPEPPAWWLASVGEWVVYWYFTKVKGFVEGKDFYYQAPVFAPFLFSSRDFTRVDFLVDFGPDSKAGQVGDYKALAIDPITAFTHPDAAFDKRRRVELDEAGYLLVFLETTDLTTRPREVLELALRGIDVSSRAH